MSIHKITIYLIQFYKAYSNDFVANSLIAILLVTNRNVSLNRIYDGFYCLAIYFVHYQISSQILSLIISDRLSFNHLSIYLANMKKN